MFSISYYNQKKKKNDCGKCSVHKHAKKELGQYPANLTSRLVNNLYLFYD